MKLKFNTQYHTYWLDGTQIKGVTNVAKIPDDTTLLEKHGKRMVAIGLATDPALVEAVAVNFDDKKKVNDLCWDAQHAAKAFVAQNRGTTLHQVTERHDMGLDLIDTTTNLAIRKAWQAALESEQLEALPDYVERIVVYPDLHLAGTLDRIMIKNGQLVIADAKGGKNAVDYPHAMTVQLALYANAPLLAGRLSPKGETTKFETMPDVDKTRGYVIWMPTDHEAEVVPIDIAAGWECFNDVIVPTLEWRKRTDLVIHNTIPLADLLEQSCPPRVVVGPTSGSVAPATTPNPEEQATLQDGLDGLAGLVRLGVISPDLAAASAAKLTAQFEEQPCPTISPNTDLTTSSPPPPSEPQPASSSSTVTAPSSTTGPPPPTGTPASIGPSSTPGTTTGGSTTDTLKTRLARIKTEHPDLYRLIINRWPAPGLRYHELNLAEHTAVLALVDELDIEGPRVTPADIQLAAEKYAALTDQQRERILAWARDCEDNSFRAFGVGGGNHTTRRLALLETCIAVAQENIDDTMFRALLNNTPGLPVSLTVGLIGQTLGQMNWQQAQALWANLRHHVATTNR